MDEACRPSLPQPSGRHSGDVADRGTSGAGIRQDFEPLTLPAAPGAVYYFPGMWDWDRRVRLPLVV